MTGMYSPSNPKKTISGRTSNGFGNLIRHLPTGTVFLFQFLNPLLTNYGHCTIINKYLTGILIGICGFSCAFASFTDSYEDGYGIVHYGVATMNGIWPCPPSSAAWMDMSKYKLRIGDFVHAFFSLIVFGVVSLLDKNTVDCFYPAFEAEQKILLMTLPPVIGSISGAVFMVFPNNRHGIGYPPPSDAQDDS